MTNTITLKLTFEELEQIDKYIELNDSTRQLFDKIQKAYPKSPVETAYKRVFGEYPPTDFDDNQWFAFHRGYSCGYGDCLEKSNEKSKNPVEKQSKTLTDVAYRWWEEVFTTHIDWDKEICVEDLIDQVEQFLPKPQSAADYQSLTAANMVEGWNNCLKKIKSKLR